MAEHVLIPLGVQLCVHRNVISEPFFTLTNAQPRLRRPFMELYSRNCKGIQFSSWNSKLAGGFTNPKVHRMGESFMTCSCMGALVNADNVSASEWVPYVDQMLLMASIFLTYIAGVIPAGKPLSDAHKSTSNDFAVPKNSSLSGSSSENDNDGSLHFAWDIVAVKLLDSLYAREKAVNISDTVSGIDEDPALHRSSLFALAELPRIRCLWASFKWLRKEFLSSKGIVKNLYQVDNISGSSIVDSTAVMTRIFESSRQPLCLAWLEEELRLKNGSANKALLSSMIEKVKGYDSILKYIRKSGKEDLYADLISSLSFGSKGLTGCYGRSLFTQYGVSVLEDLVITLAEGIASMYLELISVDGSVSTEMNSLGLNLCTLSTRQLQRLRNEVALHQWLHQNMESVVSMYEDRFELRTFQTQLIEECTKRDADNFGWWKKLSLQRSRPTSPSLSFLVIKHTSISVKRTNELRALAGWQYYFSLFLELSDIATPLIRTLIGKVSDAISFFLVCLIGRSLGLIYTGIRQSLRWK